MAENRGGNWGYITPRSRVIRPIYNSGRSPSDNHMLMYITFPNVGL